VRIGIHTWGSEGDIRPCLALGHALAARGHEVRLLYTEIGERRYEAVAHALGFMAEAVASPVIADVNELYRIGEEIVYTRDPLRQGLIIGKKLLEPVTGAIYEAGLELARRSDVVVSHIVLHAARAAADKIGTPSILLAYAHMLMPSREIHPHGLPRLGAWGNVVEWRLARLAANRTLLQDVNNLRRRVGLPTFRDLMTEAWVSPVLTLIASSPTLLKRPADWPPSVQQSGFLSLPPHAHEILPNAVEEFLANGPPPVFIGFGSMMPIAGASQLRDTIDVLTDAATQSGQRTIIQAEADLASGDRLLFVRRVPHAQLFPRCAAIVHHAGAGTTHSTLRAGVPSVPVPHVSDQFAWADELYRLGVATTPLKRITLSAAALAARIREAVGNAPMQQRAIAIQQRMVNDNGPATAAALIEDAMSRA
jgi:sterol 3beta-glucosyltransferase/vancomycin aglycone glucosyltransferase